MWNKRVRGILILVIISIAFGCINNPNYSSVVEPNIKDTPTISSDPLATTITEPEREICHSELIPVTTDYVYNIKWSEDSQILSFYTDRELTDYKEFNVVNETILSGAPQSIFTTNPEGIDNVLRTLSEVTKAEGEINNYSISPEKDKIIFSVRLFFDITPTPPLFDGEQPPNHNHHIYVYDIETLQPIFFSNLEAEILDFLWHPSEDYVVIRAGLFSPVKIDAWAVNLIDLSLTPFDEGQAYMLGFSPNGEWILIRRGRIYSVMNFENNQIEKELPVNIIRDSYWWIPGTTYLLFVSENGNNSSFLFYSYDIEKNNLVQISDIDIKIEYKMENPVIPSPDFSKIAYIEDESLALKIITLCLDGAG